MCIYIEREREVNYSQFNDNNSEVTVNKHVGIITNRYTYKGGKSLGEDRPSHSWQTTHASREETAAKMQNILPG